jgi:Flp pilus assembly protein TadD
MRSAAEKAVQLDPLSAEAYDALGLVFAREGQWQEAEQSFRRALQLDPNRSITYANFARWYLEVLGRMDEALKQLEFAEKTDPLSDEIHRGLALVHLTKRQYEDAARYAQKLPDDFNFKRILLARVYLGQKRFNDAIELLRDVAPTSGGGFLGYAYAQAGRTEEAEKLAATLTVSPFQQALIFAGLGDKNRTLEALDRMTSLGALRVGRTLNYPELALVQGDPRLIALRRKVGLPE